MLRDRRVGPGHRPDPWIAHRATLAMAYQEGHPVVHTQPLDAPVRDNQTIFEEEYEQELLATNHGEIALMRDGDVKGIFPDAAEAATEGYKQFNDLNFSLHLIGTRTYYIAPIVSTTPL